MTDITTIQAVEAWLSDHQPQREEDCTHRPLFQLIDDHYPNDKHGQPRWDCPDVVCFHDEPAHILDPSWTLKDPPRR